MKVKVFNNSVKGKVAIIEIVSYVFALLAFIICGIDTQIVDGYRMICILPLIFICFSSVIYYKINAQSNIYKITIVIFLSIQWLRMVLLPLLGSISGYLYTYGRFVDEKAAHIATNMMAYEAIIIFLFVIVLINNKHTPVEESNKIFGMRGHEKIYIGFIALAFLMFIKFGRNKFHFFALNLSEQRVALQVGNEGVTIDAIIMYGLTFLVIVILYFCYKNYHKYKNRKYVYYALLCAGLRLCILTSEGRMAQIYLLGVFLLLLPQLFPRHRKKIIKCVVIISVSVLAMMTIYKTFYAFLYDSYIEAIRSSSFGFGEIASQIDIYFYGIKTVARNIGYCSQAGTNIIQLVYDVIKNTFGVHYIVGNGYTTVQLYNLYLYSGEATSGHLFSSLAYGYMYLGAIFAPIATCFNIYFAYLVERLLYKIKYIDVYYIAGILYVRLAMSIFSNFPQTWNVISRTAIIGVLIIGGASIFKRRQKIISAKS